MNAIFSNLKNIAQEVIPFYEMHRNKQDLSIDDRIAAVKVAHRAFDTEALEQSDLLSPAFTIYQENMGHLIYDQRSQLNPEQLKWVEEELETPVACKHTNLQTLREFYAEDFKQGKTSYNHYNLAIFNW